MRRVPVAALLAGSIALCACGGGGDQKPLPDDTGQAARSEPERALAPEPADRPDLAATALADLTPDPAAGKTVFTKCMACHAIEEGMNRVGPHLHGVVGREAGTVAGFNYSDANRNSGITWSRDVLFDYLVAPQDYLPGTRMAFPGIKDPQERVDLIAFLEANGEV